MVLRFNFNSIWQIWAQFTTVKVVMVSVIQRSDLPRERMARYHFGKFMIR